MGGNLSQNVKTLIAWTMVVVLILAGGVGIGAVGTVLATDFQRSSQEQLRQSFDRGFSAGRDANDRAWREWYAKNFR